MTRFRISTAMALAVAFVAPVAGCSSDGSGGIGSIEDVQDATIYILASGVQELPTGTSASGGSGSGFFISETGLAMTNYHVVAGAATLEVYIGGDTDRAYPVSVVGASQCNDLALVQVHLDPDETVSYLRWHEGEPTVGLPIYAAGYPLGDTEFTLTSGIVSKARADGESSWASIDYTIEIDANIHQGNSGGPVVDEQGAIVGVVYANAQTISGQNQFFAIGAPLAQAVVEQLKDGDYESFGVWGYPLQADDGSYLGLWVNAVEKGSVADDSGVAPGDLITELNGLPVATDGTLSTYCDVIRTSGSDPIAITVVRLSTGEILEGDLGGEGGLTVVDTFDPVTDPGGDPGTDDPEWTDEDPYEYVSVIDDTGLIYVDLPVEWSDLVTESVDATGVGEYPAIHASIDLEAFFSDYSVPGLQLLWLPGTHYQNIDDRAGNDGHVLQSCELESVSPYQFTTPYTGREYTGEMASYINCDGTLSQVVILWANPTDGSEHVLYLAMVIASPRDFGALTTILETLSMSDAG
ncbi:MAG: trypsin-like peptidase domain-containing protein [Demequinaceae bacterium]|nr:trypsin-like peptidase domain-containing protein [Demequinaceae bacterium]